MYDLLASASTHDATPRSVRKASTHGDVSASAAIPWSPSQARRNPMKSVPYLVGLALTGCGLAASLVFGYPAVSGPLAQPVVDG